MGRIHAVFKADGAETSNRYAISEWWLEPHTTGPGAHAHDEDDVFIVLAGTMSFLVGDAWMDAEAGSFVLVPAGVRHDFENRGAVRAGVLNVSVPGGFEPHMPGIQAWFLAHPPRDTDARPGSTPVPARPGQTLAVPVTIALDALEDALHWVSSLPECECSAHVARSTGRIFCRGADGPLDPDAPDDLGERDDHVALPHRNDLELGRTLVFRFVDEFAPHLSVEVHQIFRRRGAYARFKALLQRQRLLERWHEHEGHATREALARWATENGFAVDRGEAD